MKPFTLLAAVLAIVLTNGLLDAQSHGSSPAGAWKMNIHFADGPRAAGLEITLDGRTITGRFVASFAGDIAIEGDFTGRTLTFSGTTTDGHHPGIQLDFTATAKAGGTLEGNLSTPMGDFKWTAERQDKPEIEMSRGTSVPPREGDVARNFSSAISPDLRESAAWRRSRKPGATISAPAAAARNTKSAAKSARNAAASPSS